LQFGVKPSSLSIGAAVLSPQPPPQLSYRRIEMNRKLPMTHRAAAVQMPLLENSGRKPLQLLAKSRRCSAVAHQFLEFRFRLRPANLATQVRRMSRLRDGYFTDMFFDDMLGCLEWIDRWPRAKVFSVVAEESYSSHQIASGSATQRSNTSIV
jgi:hypothetical protein